MPLSLSEGCRRGDPPQNIRCHCGRPALGRGKRCAGPPTRLSRGSQDQPRHPRQLPPDAKDLEKKLRLAREVSR